MQHRHTSWLRRAAAAVLAVLIASEASQATLVATDVLQPGDELATVDTETGIEWLDLPVTIGLSPEEVIAGSGGWIGSGWRYATTQEACSLFARYLLAISACPSRTIYFADLPLEVANFIDLFGSTFSFDKVEYSAGLLAGTAPGLFGDAIVGNEEASLALYARTGELFAVGDNIYPASLGASDFGSFLVRPVPEASTAALVAYGLAYLSIRRRRAT